MKLLYVEMIRLSKVHFQVYLETHIRAHCNDGTVFDIDRNFPYNRSNKIDEIYFSL